jgi:SAM-dependent methyltransferase
LGVLNRSDSGSSFTQRTDHRLPHPSMLWSAALPLLAGDPALRHYLENCSNLLLRVLRGEVSPLETLFPGGDNALAKDLYEQSPGSAYVNRIAAAAIAARARSGAKTAMGFPRRLRILEIGAGTGSTTAAVLALLSPDAILYTFSDVSESFLKRAQRRFQAHPVEFTLFDLDREEHSIAHQDRYDVVLIANALHAAKDLQVSLARVARVLQPGGTLVLVETTLSHAWHDVSTGLIEGWQHFADDSRDDTPLVSVHQWQDQCGKAGLANFTSFPLPEMPTHAMGLHVLIAQKPLLSSLPKVAALPVDQAAQTSITALPALSSSITDFDLTDPQPIKPLTSNEVAQAIAAASARQRLALIVEHTTAAVAHTLGRSTSPQPDARLMDLGLDSLMAIELRNRLQIVFAVEDLPSTLIFDYPTSESIARLLLAALGYASDGRPVEDVSAANNANIDSPPIASSIHTDDELDAMSDNEIADLLRMRLEQ